MSKYRFPDGSCKLTLGKDTTTWKPMYFGVAKGNPFAKELELGYLKTIVP